MLKSLTAFILSRLSIKPEKSVRNRKDPLSEGGVDTWGAGLMQTM